MKHGMAWSLAGVVAWSCAGAAIGWPAWTIAGGASALAGAAWWCHARERGARSEASGGKRAPTDATEAGVEPRLVWARELFDAIDEPVVVLDGGGTIVACNRAARRVFGERPGQSLEGRRLDEVTTDAQLPEMAREASGGRGSIRQIRTAWGGATRVVQASCAPAELGVSRGAVLTLRDVTELATAVQLKADFVANASHELRTPLASIRASMETMREFGGEDPAIRERLISMVMSNVSRVEELTRDLLDLSRLESPEARPEPGAVDAFEVAGVLAEVFETACAERRLTLAFELDERLRSMWTDRRLLMLVLQNLIDNATKFAYEGTTVRVVGRVLEHAGEDRIGARLVVTDEGIGIPLAQQARVFERFFQVDSARSGSPARRGTGLGLAIVKHAVRALSGTVGIESEWKRGTAAWVELPGSVERSSAP